ncbi:SMR family transporter [Mucilaginibacter sp. RS28]|uniref:SMR family transporter n=1 Tax=Mucilaginibacter straminoryzae TaxID=2932774 RepID=A0A9X2BA71_9SPHI|nr:SMR family transporter [Mucilaginibacter straminoryzae]MCJ8211484.1 SMR family transporter [Mucilaginibacter straminoryzae]
MAWIFILIAAVFETAWTFSLKLMTFSELKTLRFNNFYTPNYGLPILLPFLGYIVFGVGNVYFFSLATKSVSTATAYAVWTGMTLVLIKLSETFFLKQKTTLLELLFLSLIMTGILGLRFLTGMKQ